MSQQQMRPGADQEQPIRYGDVFDVTGDLAKKPVAPHDAAMMQTAEAMVFGQTPKGGPASVMQSAASRNKQAGLVGHGDVIEQFTDHEGVTVTETELMGSRIITESFAGQVIRQYTQPAPVLHGTPGSPFVEQIGVTAVTIGEALESSAHTVGDKPVDKSDAAAIQAAEVRATGSSVMVPGGLAATAQKAAASNAATKHHRDKIKLNDILSAATTRLPADKAATPHDAEGVENAELRHNPNKTTAPGGVAASVAAAARLNKRMNNA